MIRNRLPNEMLSADKNEDKNWSILIALSSIGLPFFYENTCIFVTVIIMMTKLCHGQKTPLYVVKCRQTTNIEIYIISVAAFMISVC